MRRLIPLLGLALLARDLYAQDRSSVAAEFLTLPVGARATAMGEAGVALGEDATALFWNPAGMVRAPKTSLAIGRVPYSDGGAQDHLLLSRGVGLGVLGAGVETFSHGSIDTADLDGLPTGSLSPADRQIAVGYARHFPPFPFLAGHAWGVAAKYVSSTLANSAQTYAMDLGILSPPLKEGRVQWGMSLSNLGGSLEYNQETEPLPRSARVGAVWRPNARWTAAADVVKPSDEPVSLAGGVEYAWTPAAAWTLLARAGYTSAQESVDGLRVGFGIGWRNMRMNYFYRFSEEDFGTQGIDLTLAWAERGRGLPPALQALVDKGTALMEKGQYPEAVLKFYEALKASPTCQEARDGLERAYRLMQGR